VSYAAQTPAHATVLRAERPWREHFALYRDLYADAAVAAALWPGELGGQRSAAQAGELLAADIAHWESRGFGPWLFFERATGLFVGRGGLRVSSIEGSECVQILYAVRSDAWGYGYATEMARLAIAEGRRRGVTEILGLAATGNLASRRVLEKAGLVIEATTEHAGLPHLLARIRLMV
jgi:ribosomal-protein-alanine N-acetyltransferase